MEKAYDTFLQSEVSSYVAAKCNNIEFGSEPYRYECIYCGEEVYLAAADSTKMIPHFRHRNGNNDIECKNYLGQYGSISANAHSRKHKSERAEFYFDGDKKLFYLGLRFNDSEIDTYESSSTIFELRTTRHESPCYILQINRANFYPDALKLIPLEKFSQNYFISNAPNGIKRMYEVFKDNEKPTFFKILGNDYTSDRAKLVRSKILYTNSLYLIFYQSSHQFPNDVILPDEIFIHDTILFETMNRKFLGKILTIELKTESVELLLSSWGYRLEASETLTPLWPPSNIIDEVLSIDSNWAYVYSSFELQPYGDINIHSNSINKIRDGVSRILVDSKTRIYRKNIELTIDKCEKVNTNFNSLQITTQFERVHRVSGEDLQFLFNHSGATQLSNGQSVPLTPGSAVKHYRFGYIIKYTMLEQQLKLTSEQLLNETLMYYKRKEAFRKDYFEHIKLSSVAIQYLEKCETSGLINSAAKHFIAEGII